MNESDKVDEYGKFGSAQALLDAYNALESEFTKRCQLIKQLQAALDTQSAQAEQASAEPESETVVSAPEAVRDDGDKIEVDADNGKTSVATVVAAVTPPAIDRDTVLAHAAEYAEDLADVPEVMAECVSRYKLGIAAARKRMASVPPSGMTVITPACKPKTLSDAKRLADSMLG